jgi:acetate kinase
MSCHGLEFLGIELDNVKNADAVRKEAIISNEKSRVKVLVIPTNEELIIAEDTYEITSKDNK